MPRLKESEEQKRDNVVRAYIAKNQTLYGLSDEEIAIKIRCTRRTYQNKKRKPATFTLGELRRLADAIKLSDEEKAKFM